MQYLKASPGMLDIGGSPVRRVETYKILGVHLSSDLTWNVHIEYTMKKASKRLHALRLLKKAGVQMSDLVGIYCALIRSVLEYAAPVWSGLPVYLSDVLEAVQRRAMRIIFPHADYNTALCSAGLGSLADRRDAICAKFRLKAKTILLSAIFSRIGTLLTMAINCVQVSSATSKLKATPIDLIIS